MPDVTAYVEDRQTSEFYPTPEKLVHRMLGKVKWDLIQTVLEPSAGKGDIVRGIATAPMRDYHKDRLDVDCIERILNFFDGNLTADVDLSSTIEQAFKQNITKNVKCKFFDATFYKKGTVHIVFTCPELIDRFNIYAAQQRGWLPPSYGKKQYADMDAEEKAVVDSFQGAAEYAKVMQNPGYYLAAPVKSQNLLGMGEGV